MPSNETPEPPQPGDDRPAGPASSVPDPQSERPATASYPPPGPGRPTNLYPPAPGQPTDSRSSESYRRPGYSPAWSGQGDYGSGNYPPPGAGPYGQSQYGQGASGQNPQGQNPHGQNPHGQSASGQGAYGQGEGGYGSGSYGQPGPYRLSPAGYGTSQPDYGQPDWPGREGEPGQTTTKSRLRPFVLLSVVAAVIGGGIGGGVVAVADHDNDKSVNSGLKITDDTGVKPAVLDGSIGAAAAKIRPSVVTINVTGSQEAGTGSGVIIKSNGTILTNDHVVDINNGTGAIQVVLSDGRTATGKILGRDTPDDLAVIKVEGLTSLAAATFAKSSSLTVGQTVVAVGAPLGLSDTVTSGIISNTARPVRAGDNDQAVFDAVQTDAAINPGNSGGPLVDLSGSVVGINAAIASDQSGGGLRIPGQQTQSGNIGIGFAIPSDEASRIAGELMVKGKATHAVLGVSVKSSTSTTTTAGVPLNQVTAGGVGEKAGLKVGDVVTQIDDQRVTTADALIAAVRSHAPGEEVKVSYIRGGKATSVNVTLGSSDS